MHLLVPLLFLLPIVLELVAFGLMPSFAASFAWVPLRTARRSVILGKRGDAYRTAPDRVFDRVRLPAGTLVTSAGDRVHLDASRRLAWVRLRATSATLIRLRILDDEAGFTLAASALPVPALGFLLGSTLCAIALDDLTGPTAFALPAFAVFFVVLAVWALFARSNVLVERIADALVAHVVASQPEETSKLRVESPSAETQETPSTPPPKEPTRRSSSSD